VDVPIFVDFETEEILPRPNYPPKPVGVAINEPGQREEYLAWGHPTNNNCTKMEARRRLRAVWRSGRPVGFHNAKFDLDVGETHLGLPLLPWHLIHCTSILGFLYDPNSQRLDLKELAYDLLGIEPRERDALREWIWANIPGSKAKKSNWGAFICRCPGKLVAPYAKADVKLPKRIFDFIYPKHIAPDSGMQEAYDRERQLISVLLEMEREGVPVDVRALKREIKHWEQLEELTDAWIRHRLNAPDLDVDKGEQLADALEDADLVDEWILTPKAKKRSTSADNLAEVIKDPLFLNALSYRSRLVNSLRVFGRPWWEMAKETGSIFTVWNQVRQADMKKKKNIGARTGRLSSTPNFQNAPRSPEPVVFSKRAFEKMKKAGEDAVLLDASFFQFAKKNFSGIVIELPNPRGVVIADADRRVAVRDYSQQELRILAHFEGGALAQAYNDDPWLDLHNHARIGINNLLGTNYPRKPIKNTGFGIIYGLGLDHLASDMGESRDTAKTLRDTYKALFPGLKEIDADLKERARADEPVRTWGGRLFKVEPPMVIRGYRQTFEYKLLNTLIQGSAGDCMKQAMLNYAATRKHGRMLLTVHDELVASILRKTSAFREEMSTLRIAMESVEFAVPMLSDGKAGRTWSSARLWKDDR
jgi:DNA polymerase I-like protein with 3'-5' exonuclease and polymerase domains